VDTQSSYQQHLAGGASSVITVLPQLDGKQQQSSKVDVSFIPKAPFTAEIIKHQVTIAAVVTTFCQQHCGKHVDCY
jgi:hypothetical protein